MRYKHSTNAYGVYQSRHYLYKRYHQMLKRCYDSDHEFYDLYGARGITVCEAWRGNFWIYVHDIEAKCGPIWADDLSVDRIDNDGNYEPWNVRWADQSTQSTNQRHPLRGPMSEEARAQKRARIQATRARNAEAIALRQKEREQTDEWKAWKASLSVAQKARRAAERVA